MLVFVKQWGWGVGVSAFSGKKRYEGVRFNVISITVGGWGSNFQQKKRYVTLEWPHTHKIQMLYSQYMIKYYIFNFRVKPWTRIVFSDVCNF